MATGAPSAGPVALLLDMNVVPAPSVGLTDTPGRYVGAEPQPDDGVPFEKKMARLSAQWREQQAEAQHLDAAIEENLRALGFGDGL